MKHLDLLDTNLTVWIQNHPFFHSLASDPRTNVQNLYHSKQRKLFELEELTTTMESNQATVFDSRLHYAQLTKEILEGKDPSRRQLDEPITLMARGHHLRLNDVFSNTVNTFLARLMDSGLVAKMQGKYYMTDGKRCW